MTNIGKLHSQKVRNSYYFAPMCITELISPRLCQQRIILAFASLWWHMTYHFKCISEALTVISGVTGCLSFFSVVAFGVLGPAWLHREGRNFLADGGRSLFGTCPAHASSRYGSCGVFRSAVFPVFTPSHLSSFLYSSWVSWPRSLPQHCKKILDTSSFKNVASFQCGVRQRSNVIFFYRCIISVPLSFRPADLYHLITY